MYIGNFEIFVKSRKIRDFEFKPGGIGIGIKKARDTGLKPGSRSIPGDMALFLSDTIAGFFIFSCTAQGAPFSKILHKKSENGAPVLF